MAGDGATDAPCIATNAVPLAYPEPTIVTVVPTEADDGLTTVTLVDSTVYPTELNVTPAETVWRPADAPFGTLNATWLTPAVTSGQAW